MMEILGFLFVFFPLLTLLVGAALYFTGKNKPVGKRLALLGSLLQVLEIVGLVYAAYNFHR